MGFLFLPAILSPMPYILPALTILLGAFLFIFGGYDDSPGAQGLGLLLAIYGIVRIVKLRKKI